VQENQQAQSGRERAGQIHPAIGALDARPAGCAAVLRREGRTEDSKKEKKIAHLLPYNLDPTSRMFSRRTISGGEEEKFVIHDSITDLSVVPDTSLTVT